MITEIEIQGFKCFEDEEFEVAALTLLTGMNSSGKSSFLHAARLVCGGGNPEKVGPLSGLISSNARSVKLTRYDEDGFIGTLRWDKSGVRKASFSGDVKKRFGLRWFSYISASRLGPELLLPVSDKRFLKNVGEKGEFVLDFIGRNAEESGVPERLCRHPYSTNVVRNISAWLSIISPGVQFDFNQIEGADASQANYSGHRPTNVGFGLSYSLPIIANVLVYAVIAAKSDHSEPMILIENPEAHLHPAGQTAMGKFLAYAASCGVQLLVETHSDHLLNGVRLAVKDGDLDADDAAFHFFQYDFDEECSEITSPEINSQGFFDEWPEGFFDEHEKNLARLL